MNTLPYKVTSTYDGDMVELRCDFSEPLKTLKENTP